MVFKIRLSKIFAAVCAAIWGPNVRKNIPRMFFLSETVDDSLTLFFNLKLYLIIRFFASFSKKKTGPLCYSPTYPQATAIATLESDRPLLPGLLTLTPGLVWQNRRPIALDQHFAWPLWSPPGASRTDLPVDIQAVRSRGTGERQRKGNYSLLFNNYLFVLTLVVSVLYRSFKEPAAVATTTTVPIESDLVQRGGAAVEPACLGGL